MPKKARKRRTEYELKLVEDPFLLDDPGGSPLDWIELSLPGLRSPVRRSGEGDPWRGSGFAPEVDAFTEHRRRKLQNISLHLETDEDLGDSVA